MAFWLALILLPIMASPVFADSVYRCRMNAEATRDFAYHSGTWCGGINDCDSKASFQFKRFLLPNFGDISYREFLLSFNEKSKMVSVKSFWLTGDDGKPADEFKASIVSRNSSTIYFIYANPSANKVHSYALNFKQNKLVAASVMDGATSLVVEAKTYDCE